MVDKKTLEVKVDNNDIKVYEDLTRITIINVGEQKKTVIASGNENDEAWGIAWLSPEKLLTFFLKRTHGEPWTNESRFERILQQIKFGEPIYTPVMYSRSGGIDGATIEDGRHRTKALHELGAKKIPVMVPHCQIDLFQKEFG